MWEDDDPHSIRSRYRHYEPEDQRAGASIKPGYEIVTPGPQRVYHFEFKPSYNVAPRKVGKIEFSRTELWQLGVAWAVLIMAFSMWLSRGGFYDWDPGWIIIGACVSSFTGFLLHELGHKVSANLLGHWSEFRYSVRGLIFTFLISSTGFLAAAPGAVVIAGNVSKDDEGIISICGPAVNITIGFISLGILSFFRDSFSDTAAEVLEFVILVNAILAAFNLIPVWVLDGKKILSWSPPIYAVAWVLVIFLWFT